MSKVIYDLKDVIFWGNNGGMEYEGDGLRLGDRAQLGYKLIYYQTNNNTTTNQKHPHVIEKL